MAKKTFIEEKNDGSLVITLHTGYEPAGTTSRVQEVKMREPMVRDQQTARLQGGGDVGETEMLLLAAVTELSPAELATLTARDYSRLQEGYNFFMD